MDLVCGLLKYWPISCPAKEIIYISVVEESIEGTILFAQFGPQLIKQIIKTAQGMHFQAAEKALVFLNSETLVKFVKTDL